MCPACGHVLICSDRIITARRAGAYPDELRQGVVDERSAGQEEAAAGAQVMEEEQLLVLEEETRLLSINGRISE